MPRLLLLALVAALALPASAQSSQRLRNTADGVKPAGGAPAQLGTIVGDGSFEAGTPNPSWAEASVNFGTPLCTLALCGTGGGTGPNTGDWWAWFGGSATGDAGSVEQSVTIPAGSAQLKFWLEIPVIATGGTGYVSVLMGTTEVFRATYAADQPAYATYQEVTVDATAFAGTTTTLRFESVTTGSGNFFIDDVSIEAAPAGPSLTLLPIHFGGVQVGETGLSTVQLQNTGGTPLTITGVTLDDPSGSFAITQPELPLPAPIVLGPQNTIDLFVTFTPSTTGPASASVTVVSDDPASPSTATITGTGTNLLFLSSTDTPVEIPDDTPAGIVSTIVIPPSETRAIADLDVELEVIHPWIGDLVVALRRSGATLVLIDRPGHSGAGDGCSGADFSIVLDDEGTDGAVETSCIGDANPGYPVPGGRYTPEQPLGAFDHTAIANTYELLVSDVASGIASGEPGALVSWTLIITPQGGVAAESGPSGVARLTVSPNPATTQGQVALSVAVSQDVRVALYDALGREVRVLLERSLVAGQQAHIAFRTDDLPAGVYVVRAVGTDVSLTERVTVVR